MTEPGRIDLDHRGRDQLRRRPARDQRGGDDDVLLGDVAGGQLGLLGLVFLRHFLGVAAGGLGLLELLVLDGEEFGAQALDLLLGGGPHVGGGDDGAEAPRRGDRLQAGDADAHDEDLRAAGTVPAAVIIIGSARPYSAAPSITAR